MATNKEPTVKRGCMPVPDTTLVKNPEQLRRRLDA